MQVNYRVNSGPKEHLKVNRRNQKSFILIFNVNKYSNFVIKNHHFNFHDVKIKLFWLSSSDAYIKAFEKYCDFLKVYKYTS